MEWKQIDGYENYEVSNEGGLVRNKKTGRILKQFQDRGYLYVSLSKNSKAKRCSVHRLVATAFIPNPHGYDTVDHIDKNRQNNDVSNLRWMSHKNNCANTYIHEPRKVRCIELDQIYDSVGQAGRETGLASSGIIFCCQGKLKTCGGMHWEYVE